MKCKVFKINLENDFDETKLNEFLENAALHQVFASIAGGETPFWSVLVLYEDKKASSESSLRLEMLGQLGSQNASAPEPVKPTAPKKEIAAADIAPEPVKLTAEQDQSYNLLRNWRNERAGQDGVPPYLIAQNDSLMQLALLAPKTSEELLQIKGLGEKRVQKYGGDILRILNAVSE